MKKVFCKNCGAQLSDDAVVCPYCGIPTSVTDLSAYGKPVVKKPVNDVPNPIAIVGFVFSFIVGIVGLILSIIGLKRAKNGGGSHKGLAIAGIVISVVSIVIEIIAAIILLTVLNFLAELLSLLYLTEV